MKQFKYTITDPQGIHARPAGDLVKAISGFSSAITIQKGEKNVDAKRIFGIMSLAAKQGDEITIMVEGEDEEEAMAAIKNILENQL